jgi:hypothetical protein
MQRFLKKTFTALISIVSLILFVVLVWPLGSIIRGNSDPLRLKKKPALATYRRPATS